MPSPLVQAADGADGLPGGLVPAGPGDDIDEFAVPGSGDSDVLDEDAQQFLAVGLAGGRGVLDLREISGQGLDRRAFCCAEGLGLFLGEPLAVRFQPARFGERGFPVGFQLPGDEAAFRFGELELAACGDCSLAAHPAAPIEQQITETWLSVPSISA
jgi:hypothetical protein